MDVGSHNSQQKLLFNILEYLQDLKTANSDIAESLEVAIQCISDSFGFDTTNNTHKQLYSIKPLSLLSVFGLGLARKEQIESVITQQYKASDSPAHTSGLAAQAPDFEARFNVYRELLQTKGYFDGIPEGSPEYLDRLAKAKAKFLEKYQPEQASNTTEILSNEDKVKIAEGYKVQGNQQLSTHQYQAAIDLYSKAIELNDTNAIYYANRAAAYSHLNQHSKAISDCKAAVQRNPEYSKAYSRMGLAHFSLGEYKEAVQNYKRALELDPTNSTLKESLDSAEKKISQSVQQTPNLPNNLGDILNNPTFQSLAQQFRGGEEAGINPNAANTTNADLSGLLNNPNLMNMAQSVMSQPEFSQMMNNPAMMNMAQSFMQNPEALGNILQGVFGQGKSD